MAELPMNIFRYLDKLRSLDSQRTMLKGKKLALFLSGSSDYRYTGLSPVQKDLMYIFTEYGYTVPNSNFPYHFDMDYHQAALPPICIASLHNMLYYRFVMHSRRMRAELVRHLKPLEQAKEAVIVAGSSGLHLLREAIEGLDLSGVELTVFALGPVSDKLWDKKTGVLIVFKGNLDYFSRYMDKHKTDFHLACNHFQYTEHKKVRKIIYEWCRKNQN